MPDTVTVPVDAANGNTPRKAWWKSRKLWYAVIAAALPLINEACKLDLTPDTVFKAAAPFLTLLGIEAAADLVKVHHEAKARADS
ncbi:MAG: hypothetical protein AAB223_11480 [Pseudomonadota bacterium]